MIINSPIIGVGNGNGDIADLPNALVLARKQFLTLRQRFNFIEWILDNNETMANSLTGNSVMMYYIMEYDEVSPRDDDTFGADRDNDDFSEPEEKDWLFYSEDGVYRDAERFVKPTIFYEGLMSAEEEANLVSDTPILMDVVMNN